MISDQPKKRRSAASTAMLLATIGMIGGFNPLAGLGSRTPKPPKDKPIEFTPDEDAKLDALYSDKSSQGRKAYKAYRAELHSKYTKTV